MIEAKRGLGTVKVYRAHLGMIRGFRELKLYLMGIRFRIEGLMLSGPLQGCRAPQESVLSLKSTIKCRFPCKWEQRLSLNLRT